jgi:hypothetical protein
LQLEHSELGPPDPARLETASAELTIGCFDELLNLVSADKARFLSQFRDAIRVLRRSELQGLAEDRMDSLEACAEAARRIGDKPDTPTPLALDVLEDYRFVLHKTQIWQGELLEAKKKLFDIKDRLLRTEKERPHPKTAPLDEP